MATREVTAAGPGLSLSIGRMTEHDLLEVVEIEENSGLSVWGWDAYHKELHSGEDVIMLVARNPPRTGKAEGGPGHEHAIASFIVSRLVSGELHVNNVAVRPEFRRQGRATQRRRRRRPRPGPYEPAFRRSGRLATAGLGR